MILVLKVSYLVSEIFTTLKAVLTSFIKHLLSTLFLAHRDLLMGRIKKKQTIIQQLYNIQQLYKNL